MKIREMISFRGLKDDIDEMSRNKNKSTEQPTNPMAIAKTCVVSTVVSLPASILSFISKEFFMGAIFLVFAIMGIVFATMLNVKATQTGYAFNSADENTETTKAEEEPRISTREKMRMRKEQQAQLGYEETTNNKSDSMSDEQ